MNDLQTSRHALHSVSLLAWSDLVGSPRPDHIDENQVVDHYCEMEINKDDVIHMNFAQIQRLRTNVHSRTSSPPDGHGEHASTLHR
jgi:hypothetical protein